MTANSVRHLAVVTDLPVAPMVAAPRPVRRRWFARRPWWWPREQRAWRARVDSQLESAFAAIQVLSGESAAWRTA